MTTTKLGAPPAAAKAPSTTRPSVPAVPGSTTGATSTAEVAKALGVTAASQAPVGAFDGAASEKAGLINPRGEHVATSADPGALWGQSRGARPQGNPELRAAMAEFRAMTPEAQQAKVAELKTKQDALSKQMLVRIEKLDERYKTMLNTSKAEMLRELSSQTDALTPEEKAELSALLDKAEGFTVKLEALRAQANALPDSKTATPEEKAQRTELARQMKNLRSRRSEATRAATTYVDNLGLKAERLAVNEQRIDPAAPPKESPKSLFSMMAEWFKLDRFIGFFTGFLASTFSASAEQQERAAQQERRVEERKADDRRIEQRRDELVRGDQTRVERTAERKQQWENLEDLSRREQLNALNGALATLPRPGPSKLGR